MSNPIVTITMEDGRIMRGELYPEKAPNTVNNFISLANKGFYDGLTFHRVIPGFMIQGGCPNGNGMGGPGYEINGEFAGNGFRQNDLIHETGVLSMARTMAPNSAGSQFFVMVAPAPHLDGQYAAFGKITEGQDVAIDISRVQRNMMNDMPKKPVVMATVRVDTQGVEYPAPETHENTPKGDLTMKTAVITGASSGLGREFVRQFYSVFPEIERVWLIARRTDRLQELAEQLEEKGISTLTLPLDLCDTMSFTAYQEHLVEEQPEIALLVNNAGCGYLGNIGEIDTVSQTRMIDLNLRALTAITNLSVPYMEAGSRILNVSSIASFCPTPRMTVYSATKAYVSASTIGAAEELKAKGITVTAVCPGPMATEFLAVGHVVDSRPFELLPYCDQVQVAGGALRAARAGQTIYTPRLFYKFYRLLAKLTPAKLMVKLTKT